MREASFQLSPNVVWKGLRVAVQVGEFVRFLINDRLRFIVLLPDDNRCEAKQYSVDHADDGIDEPGHLVVELEHLHADPAPCQQSACDREEYHRPNEEDAP